MPALKPILAYHVVFGAYGFWLPNDPRGSWSKQVWAENLKEFGAATKVDSRHSQAKQKHDYQLRQQAKRALLFPAIRFTGVQAREIGAGFATTVQLLALKVYAAAIMPDHVHLVIGRHATPVETIVAHLKRTSTRALNQAQQHPLAAYRDFRDRTPSPWCRGLWKIYLHDEPELLRTINYVNQNPGVTANRLNHGSGWSILMWRR